VAGRYLGSHPRLNVSMMSMRPPQYGHGRESIGGSAASADLGSSGIASGCGTFSNARALAMLSARLPLAGARSCGCDGSLSARCASGKRRMKLACHKCHELVPLGTFNPVVLYLNVTPIASAAIRRRLEMATRCV